MYKTFLTHKYLKYWDTLTILILKFKQGVFDNLIMCINCDDIKANSANPDQTSNSGTG